LPAPETAASKAPPPRSSPPQAARAQEPALVRELASRRKS
jgi:hypothetical protein